MPPVPEAVKEASEAICCGSHAPSWSHGRSFRLVNWSGQAVKDAAEKEAVMRGSSVGRGAWQVEKAATMISEERAPEPQASL